MIPITTTTQLTILIDTLREKSYNLKLFGKVDTQRESDVKYLVREKLLAPRKSPYSGFKLTGKGKELIKKYLKENS